MLEQPILDKYKNRPSYQPPPPEDNHTNYKKLLAVMGLALLFIAGEFVGGFISHSISVISDAFHMVTDLFGFVLSFLFLWSSKKKPNDRMTFGYHRMELLGALANLFIIWVLALFLLYQATNRIINKEFVEEPLVMLIVAGVGLPVNILMFFILHSGGAHSHGLMTQSCGQQFPTEEFKEHDNCGYRKKISKLSSSSSIQRKISSSKSIQRINSVQKINAQEQIQNKQISTDALQTPIKKTNKKPKDELHKQHDHNHDHSQPHMHPHTHQTPCEVVNQQSHQHDHPHPHSHSHSHKQQHSQAHTHQHSQHSHSAHSSHPHHSHSHTHSHGHGHSHGHHHSHENMSMKAAVLHVISDIIQSIGLIISSLIIFFAGSDMGKTVTQWNDVHYCDPITTYIFCVLVFISTAPIAKNCYHIVMESTPDYVSITDLQKKFQKIDGVVDVHDLHVWELRPGKIILIAHVFSQKGKENQVLKALTDLSRQNRIYHSTFQVEDEEMRNDEHYILCDQDIH